MRSCQVFVTTTLEQALPYFGRRIHGFDDDDVVMTGVETGPAPRYALSAAKTAWPWGRQAFIPSGKGLAMPAAL